MSTCEDVSVEEGDTVYMAQIMPVDDSKPVIYEKIGLTKDAAKKSSLKVAAEFSTVPSPLVRTLEWEEDQVTRNSYIFNVQEKSVAEEQ
jgi:hypothetical protein